MNKSVDELRNELYEICDILYGDDTDNGPIAL